MEQHKDFEDFLVNNADNQEAIEDLFQDIVNHIKVRLGHEQLANVLQETVYALIEFEARYTGIEE